jgi:hypothetical protein
MPWATREREPHAFRARVSLAVVLVIGVLQVLQDLIARMPSETNQTEDNGVDGANTL